MPLLNIYFNKYGVNMDVIDEDFKSIFIGDYLFLCYQQIIEYRKVLNIDGPDEGPNV